VSASYKFNKHNIDHVFCKSCGINSFAHGKGRDGRDQKRAASTA
jgi:hypothetical protein